MMNTTDLLTPMGLGFALFAAANIAFGFAIRNLLRAKKSRSWPTVECTILEAKVVVGNKGSRPRIVYRYQFGGKAHESARVLVGGMWETSGDGSAQMVKRFPKGSIAAVALDPRNPAYSVLVPGVRLHQVASVGFGAVVFLAAWAIAYLLVFETGIPPFSRAFVNTDTHRLVEPSMGLAKPSGA